MKHSLKRCLALLLVMVMMVTSVTPAFATTTDTSVPDDAIVLDGGGQNSGSGGQENAGGTPISDEAVPTTYSPSGDSVEGMVNPAAYQPGVTQTVASFFSSSANNGVSFNPDAGIMLLAATGVEKIYVANGANGGHQNNDGSDTSHPMLNLQQALEKAVSLSSSTKRVEIVLLSDINIQQPFSIDTTKGKEIVFTSSAGKDCKIEYNGSQTMGHDEGVIKIQGGTTKVTFDAITLSGGTGSTGKRVLYVSGSNYNNGPVVTMNQVEIINGFMPSSNQAVGGAGMYVGKGAVVTATNTQFSNNQIEDVNGGGGAIYIADGGTVKLGSVVNVCDNVSGKGGGIYVAGGGRLEMQDTVHIYDNRVIGGGTECGVGLYLEYNGYASVDGAVEIYDNEVNGKRGHGVYLACGEQKGQRANMMLTGAGTAAGTDAQLAIDCDQEVAYRLIALPEEGYEIKQTVSGDEYGWFDDCDTWDIRYMVYPDLNDPSVMVPGLYLCWRTLDITFDGVQSMTNIKGPDINHNPDADFDKDGVPPYNNPAMDYMNDDMAAIEKKTHTGDYDFDGDERQTLIAHDIVLKNGSDYVVTLYCDPELYRAPTRDIVSIQIDGNDYDGFGYEYDVEAGTAKITIPGDVVVAAKNNIHVDAKADKYYNMTLKMVGPLYTMSKDGVVDNRLWENTLVWTEESRAGTTSVGRVTRDGSNDGLPGVMVQLFDAVSHAPAGPAEKSDAEGYVHFTGLTEGKNYYPVLTYEKLYRVIRRDVFDLKLSTLEGQVLDNQVICATESGGPGTGKADIMFDAATGDSTIKDVHDNVIITYSIVQDMVIINFHLNTGDSTTANTAWADYETKQMAKTVPNYGELPNAGMVGYIFDGWFTEDGEKIEPETPFEIGVSATELYAHWTRRTDIEYKIQHWVEYDPTGANGGYVPASKPEQRDLLVHDGVTYYLYETTDHADGTADMNRSIEGQDLNAEQWVSDGKNYDHVNGRVMSWWIRNGFTDHPKDEENFVLANGTSVFIMLYDRNTYNVNFEVVGSGTGVPDDTNIPSQSVDFGSQYGRLPIPHMPGYEFGGWYDPDGNLVNVDSWHTIPDDITLTTRWNARKDVCYAIYVMTAELTQCRDPLHDHVGMWHTTGDYLRSKVVYLDNEGNVLNGEADTTVTFDISSINELSLEGFHYIGYNSVSSPHGMTLSDSTAKVYVKPTDASTANGNRYNQNFDGGIVYLFYDRDTRPITVIDGQGREHEDEIIYGGDFVHKLPEDPVKDGYDFAGWVDPDGNPVENLTPAGPYVTADPNNPLIITPTWKVRDYNLTYIPGAGAKYVAQPGTNATDVKPVAGGGYVDPNKIYYDQPIGEMPTATKPGYTFKGWKLEGNDAFITSNTVASIENVIVSNAPTYDKETTRPLYASFDPHVYILDFNPGEAGGVHGTVGVNSLEVTFDQRIPTLPTPTLPGYRFVGWQLDPNDPSTTISAGQIWDKAYGETGVHIPVYATWVPNVYHYRFNLNDNIGSTRGALVSTDIDYGDVNYGGVYGDVLTVEARRPGYIFKGWSLTRDGEVLTPDDINYHPSDVELYAIWEPKLYPVKLVMKGGVINDLTDNTLECYDPTASYDALTDTWTILVAFDTTYGDLPVAVKPNTVFSGYLVDAPHWLAIHNEIINYLPTYVDYEDEMTVLTAVLEPCFTFDPDGGRFVSNGSEIPWLVLKSDLEKIGRLPEVEKDGYTHLGWKDENGNEITIDDLLGRDDPITVTPIYSPNVSFNPNGGMFDDGDGNTRVVPRDEVDEMPVPTRPGWTFLGWQDDGGVIYDLDDVKNIDRPLNLTAAWQANIILDPNGGTFLETGSGDPWHIPSNDFEDFPGVERPGYTFVGWEDKDGNPVNPDDLIGIDTPTEIHAVWAANITFNANGGTVNGSWEYVRRLADDSPLPEATRASNGNMKYSLIGWFTAPSGGEQVNLKELQRVGKPVTVYAHWQATPINVYYPPVVPPTVDPGIDIPDENPPLAGTIKITFVNSDIPSTDIVSGTRVERPADPVRAGFDFTGWYKDSECKIPFDFNDILDKDTPIYAGWDIAETPANSWFENDHIVYIKGYDTGLIAPMNNLTRAEAAMIFYRLLKSDLRTQYYAAVSGFDDVASTAWYSEAVATLTRIGILKGVGGNRFNPNAAITRAEFATICARFDPTLSDSNIQFSDVGPGHWAYQYIKSAATKGWVGGYGDGTFRPDENITRAEAVTMINRVLGRDTITTSGMLPGMITWPDNMDQTKWYYEAMQEASNGHDYSIGSDFHEVWTELVK